RIDSAFSRLFCVSTLRDAITRRLFSVMGLSGVEPLTSRSSGVRSNHLRYRPGQSASHHPVTSRKDAKSPRNRTLRTSSCNMASWRLATIVSHSQSCRGPLRGRNSSSSSSSNSSSRSSYSSRSSRSSSSNSSSSSSSSKSSSRSLSSSKSSNSSSSRLSLRRLSDQSDVSRDNIVTPS